jgi:hypothetical protein
MNMDTYTWTVRFSNEALEPKDVVLVACVGFAGPAVLLAGHVTAGQLRECGDGAHRRIPTLASIRSLGLSRSWLQPALITQVMPLMPG